MCKHFKNCFLEPPVPFFFFFGIFQVWETKVLLKAGEATWLGCGLLWWHWFPQTLSPCWASAKINSCHVFNYLGAEAATGKWVTISLAWLLKQQYYLWLSKWLVWCGRRDAMVELWKLASVITKLLINLEGSFFFFSLRIWSAHWCLWGWGINITSFSHSLVFQSPGGISLWNKSCVWKGFRNKAWKPRRKATGLPLRRVTKYSCNFRWRCLGKGFLFYFFKVSAHCWEKNLKCSLGNLALML